MQDINLDIQNSKEMNKSIDIVEDKIDEISYVKLHEHIVNSHPKNIENGEIQTFNLCENMGSYSLICSK